MRKLILTFGAVVGLSLTTLVAQTVVLNPTKVVFSCPDHAVDTNHDIRILRQDGTQLSIISDVGDPAAVSGDVTLPFNVQPILFGDYTVQVRAKVTPASGPVVVGEWSVSSALWRRTLETPGTPRVER